MSDITIREALEESYLHGIDECISIVENRRRHYECYREPGAMQTKPAVFATLDEVLVFMKALRERAMIKVANGESDAR